MWIKSNENGFVSCLNIFFSSSFVLIYVLMLICFLKERPIVQTSQHLVQYWNNAHVLYLCFSLYGYMMNTRCTYCISKELIASNSNIYQSLEYNWPLIPSCVIREVFSSGFGIWNLYLKHTKPLYEQTHLRAAAFGQPGVSQIVWAE